MPAITPSFMWDLESRMRNITEQEYQRLLEKMWWQRITKVFESENKTERISWLLSTASIEQTDRMGGNIPFEDMVALTTEFTAVNAAMGLKLTRNQLEDLDANGVELAAHWSGQIGAYAAYWPQKLVAQALLAGESATAYDGANYFANNHPGNPQASGGATYANLFTGVAGAGGADASDPLAASYPGKVIIDSSVTLDVAFQNLSAVLAYIRSLKMPNGVDPRHLEPAMILHPPQLTVRVQQLTDAKFIAQAAASGGGSGDVQGILRNWGLGDPVEALELASDPTTFYIAVKQLGQSSLGAMTYFNREPFKVTYYTGQGGATGLDAILDRARELEWHVQGRNVAGVGHPYLLFKCKAT